MTVELPPRQRFRSVMPVLAGILCTVLAAQAVALAAERDLKRHPGYVDGSEFADLAGEDGELVEITISGTLLKPLSGIFANGNADLGRLVAQLDWIGAVVVGAEGASQPASKLVGRKESELQRKGWERLAVVRDSGEYVTVLIRTDGEIVRGLVVMVASPQEIVFTNIVGVLDLALIGQLGAQMEIPGLEHVNGSSDGGDSRPESGPNGVQ